MESIIITISIFLFIFNSFGINVSAPSFIPKVIAGESAQFEYQLVPAKREVFPYRVKGTPLFNALEITAESAIVIDENTGRVLFEKDSYDKKSIASLTKLMTALVWWEVDGDLNKIVEIKPQDYREGGIAYFISGEKVHAKDLLHAGLIASSNSAMAALVRSTGITTEEFVNLMNEYADKLGMKNTRFKEPTGLDFKNISTVTDLFILARAAFKNPIISNTTQLREYKFQPLNKTAWRTMRNTNWLLTDSLNNGNYNILGGKTGYIDESGYNLIIEVHNEARNQNLIVAVLGSVDKSTRFTEAKELIEWTYENHIWEI
ncbi:D-alanyl-D-alanine carboxypeptidase family protein [Patescibacteria group bacterium]